VAQRLFAGDEHSCRLEWHVPVDETHTRIFMRYFDKACARHAPAEERTAVWYANLQDEKGEWLSNGYSIARSRSGWSKEPLDRTREHLVDSDAAQRHARQVPRRRCR